MLIAPFAYIGHAAGLTTSLLWTMTSLFFTAAGKRIGPTAVNASRIAFAIVLLALTHRFLNGVWIPEALPRQFFLLAQATVTLSRGFRFHGFAAVVHSVRGRRKALSPGRV